jgi:hypothetical protein
VASITHATVATGTDAGNGEIRKAQWNEDHVLDGVPYAFAQSGVAVSVGAVTTEAVLATISFAGGEIGASGWVEVWTSWSVNNNANTKNLRVRVGGIGGTAFMDITAASSASALRPTMIIANNSVSSQKSGVSNSQGSGVSVSGGAVSTASVNTAAAWDLVITGQKPTSAADTVTLEGYTVRVCYGA